MDRQPILEGERLILRPLEEADWPAFHAAAGDPLIWEQHPDSGRWRDVQCRAWFEGALAEGGALAAIDRQTGVLCGSSRFQLVDFAPDVAVIGSTFLARNHWGGSFNREMKRLMLTHALAAKERVWFLIGEENRRSLRAMEKIGGMPTGETFVAQLAHGPVAHLIYEIDRKTFASGPLVKQSPRPA